MLSYGNPICTVTNQPARIFCCTEDCARPAFACSEECLFINHVNHSSQIWDRIEGSVRAVIELPLAKEQLPHLEKQEKQMIIMTEELKALQAEHSQSIIRSKQRLELKKIAEKVFFAIRNKATDGITGNDMAFIVKAFEQNDLYANRIAVRKAIEQRYNLIDQLRSRIVSVIGEYKQKLSILPEPQLIPKSDSYFTPTIDLKNINNMVIVDNGIMTVKIGSLSIFPVFAKQQFNDGLSFEVKVVDAADKAFMIGVATADLKNMTNKFGVPNSLCLHAYGRLLYDGASQKLNFQVNTNDIITVKRTAEVIEWLGNGESLCAVPIPNKLIKQLLFPVCWIGSSDNSAKISKLGFV